MRSYLDKIVVARIQKSVNMAVGICHADQRYNPYPQKLALTLPTSDGHSVGIVHSWTKATEFS
jgi:hypothetical protein